MAEFPQIDSGLAVPVFKQGDDPIDAINKMMSFLTRGAGFVWGMMVEVMESSRSGGEEAGTWERVVAEMAGKFGDEQCFFLNRRGRQGWVFGFYTVGPCG
nr:hypothetical protein [Tanacetum cinerariifolium]